MGVSKLINEGKMTREEIKFRDECAMRFVVMFATRCQSRLGDSIECAFDLAELMLEEKKKRDEKHD